jgi:hypothetical protein
MEAETSSEKLSKPATVKVAGSMGLTPTGWIGNQSFTSLLLFMERQDASMGDLPIQEEPTDRKATFDPDQSDTGTQWS